MGQFRIDWKAMCHDRDKAIERYDAALHRQSEALKLAVEALEAAEGVPIYSGVAHGYRYECPVCTVEDDYGGPHTPDCKYAAALAACRAALEEE